MRDGSGHVVALGPGAERWLAMGLSDAAKRSNRATYQHLVAEVLGLDPSLVREPILEPSAADAAWAASFVRGMPSRGKLVGLNTGAGGRWAYKQWTCEHQETFVRLVTDGGDSVLLLGGPEEGERHRQLLAAATGRAVFDGGNHNSFGRFAALIDRCSVVVTSDSLATHVAAARKVLAVLKRDGDTAAIEADLASFNDREEAVDSKHWSSLEQKYLKDA